MSVWFDKAAKRYRIRIQRRGATVRRILPPGITKAQAEEFHTNALREFFAQTELGKRPDYSIADALNRLIEDELPKLRTAHHVQSNIRALLPHVRGKALADIGDVARSYSRTFGLTPATINRRLAVLRRAANLAYKQWHWLDRPVHISLLPENNARHIYLSRGELELLAWFAEKWHKLAGDLILVAGYTGMRAGEIFKLTPADIRDHTAYLRDTKNREPRAVPLIPRIRKPLKRFVGAKDREGRRWIMRAFEHARGALLRPEWRFHDLRHTTGSMLINAGVDLYTTGEILGHKDKRSTARYAHLALDRKRDALSKIAPKARAKKKKAA